MSLYDVLVMAGFTKAEARGITEILPHSRRMEIEQKCNETRYNDGDYEKVILVRKFRY